MAYEVIDLGQGRILQDTTSDIPPVVDAALLRAEEYPIYLARQLRTVYGVFPKLLKQLINLHGTAGERVLLAENLEEEDGSGDPTCDHRVLYDQFLDSLVATGVTNRPPQAPAGNNQSSMAPITANALLSAVSRGSYVRGVATVYGLERRAPRQMEQIRDFFRAIGGAALDMTFFDLHMVDDQEHASQFEGLVAAEIETPRDLVDAQRGISMVTASDMLFWHSI